MKIVVADYDNTVKMYRQEMNPKNVPAIRRWRDRGNRFGFATGRDRNMIQHEIDRYAIPVDFLICLNGATLHDGEGRLLKARTLDDDLIPAVLGHPAGAASTRHMMLGVGPSYVHVRDGYHTLDLSLPYTFIDHQSALEQRNVSMISLSYPTEEEGRMWVGRLNEDFAGRVVAHQNIVFTDVNRPDVNKAAAVAEVTALLGWEDARVFAVGDGGNDVEMVERYHGFTVPNAAPEVKAVANGIYDDVADMLEDLLRD